MILEKNHISPEDFQNVYTISKELMQEIENVVVGKHREVLLLVTCLLAGGHVLIEDVPGVGKTTLAASLAKAAGLDFRRAQFTPDVTASDITGFNLYNRSAEDFEFRQGLVMTNILLADEINRASPKTQSALLEAMEESRVTVDGKTYPIPDPFMVIATQNPTGFVGTYPLPEAQLDRFAMKLSMGYPTIEEETDIIMSRKDVNPLDAVHAKADISRIRLLRAVAHSITIDPALCTYIVALTAATRQNKNLLLGASPRASLALMHIAQAYAFLRGRDYVIPEDIATVYRQVVAHRLILKQEARLSGITANDILTDILHKTEVPYQGKN